MNFEKMPHIWVPVVAAVVGGVVSLFATQLEVFTTHQNEIEKLNDELFLRSRVEVYVDFVKYPTDDKRKHLILMGSKDVVKAMGELYSQFCQKIETRDDGSEIKVCEHTCEENRAFVKLYQAMRNDFKVTRMLPLSDDELYLAKFEQKPDCPAS